MKERKGRVSKKKEERERIINSLWISNMQVWQDRPYTAVKVVVYIEIPDDPYDMDGVIGYATADAIGFCKVCWPDKWDAEYGIDLAKRKALVKIAKALQEGRG